MHHRYSIGQKACQWHQCHCHPGAASTLWTYVATMPGIVLHQEEPRTYCTSMPFLVFCTCQLSGPVLGCEHMSHQRTRALVSPSRSLFLAVWPETCHQQPDGGSSLHKGADIGPAAGLMSFCGPTSSLNVTANILLSPPCSWDFTRRHSRPHRR